MSTGSERITIAILAGGGPKRPGGPKQMKLYQGTSLIRYLVKNALDSRANKVAVVLGADLEQIEAEIESMPVKLIRNADWEKGVGTSVAMTIEAVREDSDAILFTESDRPLVGTPYLNSLIETFRSSTGKIIGSAYSGTVGLPAVFPSKYFDKLASLTGAAGADDVIRKHPSSVIRVPFPDGAVDIDMLTDLKKFN